MFMGSVLNTIGEADLCSWPLYVEAPELASNAEWSQLGTEVRNWLGRDACAILRAGWVPAAAAGPSASRSAAYLWCPCGCGLPAGSESAGPQEPCTRPWPRGASAVFLPKALRPLPAVQGNSIPLSGESKDKCSFLQDSWGPTVLAAWWLLFCFWEEELKYFPWPQKLQPWSEAKTVPMPFL